MEIASLQIQSTEYLKVAFNEYMVLKCDIM